MYIHTQCLLLLSVAKRREANPARTPRLGGSYLKEAGLDHVDDLRGKLLVLVSQHGEHVDDGLGVEGEIFQRRLVVLQRLLGHVERGREGEGKRFPQLMKERRGKKERKIRALLVLHFS